MGEEAVRVMEAVCVQWLTAPYGMVAQTALDML